MPLTPDLIQKNFGLPQNTSALIDQLDEENKVRAATVEKLSTEGGRLQLAFEAGKRDLVENLMKRQARKGG